ncbi:hypothetical protein EMIT091MI3_10214 [Kosakonia quasisacchari]
MKQISEMLPQLIQQELMKLPQLKSALSDGLRHGSRSCVGGYLSVREARQPQTEPTVKAAPLRI